ncbi:MAG TPA: ComEC/Rec2 family competence protein [Candidatus Paceibacterota bacterium]
MSRARQSLIFALPICLLITNIFVWYIVWRETPQGILTVAFLDVGQGDAIYIEAPSGNQVLIDGGSGRQVLRGLGEVMPFYDHSIDVLIATHPDADHIGGLPFVLDRFAVGAILEPGVTSETVTYREFEKRASDGTHQHFLARRGMRLELDENLRLEILFPDQDTTGWETNTASIVARLIYGETSFLLTGDSPLKIEKYLLSLDVQSLQSDVLKAGHHGSRTSTALEYAAAVDPDYVIISAGLKNRYGHPHQEVLDIFNRLGTVILRTDQWGTIIFRSDGRTLTHN